MFPLYNLNGQVIGFSGRIYDDSNLNKYLNIFASKIINYYNSNLLGEEAIQMLFGFICFRTWSEDDFNAQSN